MGGVQTNGSLAGDPTAGSPAAAAAAGTLERLRSLCPTISVGTLTADLMHLGDELALLEQAGVGIVHVDVMDGCFCPAMTVGPPYIKGLHTSLLKDVHLMIDEPLDKLAAYVAAGADIITVQVESAIHIHRVLQHLGSMEHASGPGRGLVRGLALNPGTPLEWLAAPLLDEVDLVVLLAVDPGWSGQTPSPDDLCTCRKGQGADRRERQRDPGLRRRRRYSRQHRSPGGFGCGHRCYRQRRVRREGGGRERRIHAVCYAR